MTKSFNRKAVYAVFNLADKESASFAESLMELGIASRTDARPLAMEWAADKYKVKITQGQRGAMLPRNSAAEQAAKRVLQVCYPSADAPKPKTPKATANKTDAVDLVLKKYKALSASEKRRFLKSI